LGGASKGAAVGATGGFIVGGLSALVRNPIVLDATVKAIRAAQKVAPAAAAVGAQAIEKDGEDEGAKPDKDIANAQTDQDTAGWHHIQTGEKHYLIHPEDLAEAQRRDPSLKIHGPQT